LHQALAGNAHELPFSEVFHIFPDTSGGGFFMYDHILPLLVFLDDTYHAEKMTSSVSTCNTINRL
jgi:hypothetical protein